MVIHSCEGAGSLPFCFCFPFSENWVHTWRCTPTGILQDGLFPGVEWLGPLLLSLPPPHAEERRRGISTPYCAPWCAVCKPRNAGLPALFNGGVRMKGCLQLCSPCKWKEKPCISRFAASWGSLEKKWLILLNLVHRKWIDAACVHGWVGREHSKSTFPSSPPPPFAADATHVRVLHGWASSALLLFLDPTF